VTMGQSKFEGTYLFPKQKAFVTEILTIDSDGLFKYFYYDCQYLKLGQGHIVETKDSLILKFERISGADYQTIQTKFESGDSISIKLKVIFKDDALLVKGGSVFIQNLRTGTLINQDGLAEFKSLRPKTTDTLEINQIGYIPIFIPLNPKHSEVTGTVILSNTFYFDNGDILKYHIDVKKRIQLYPGDHYYSKISKARARHIIKDWDRNGVKLTL
jgi:hypothetical protein